ncbi:MAG: hypothetical protein WDW36_002987 [Sanguina aurantia]
MSCCVEYQLLFQESDPIKPTDTPLSFNLKPVCTEAVQLSRVAAGVFDHHGATFDEMHSCLAVTSVFSYVRGFVGTSALPRLKQHTAKLQKVAGSGWLCRGASTGTGAPPQPTTLIHSSLTGNTPRHTSVGPLPERTSNNGSRRGSASTLPPSYEDDFQTAEVDLTSQLQRLVDTPAQGEDKQQAEAGRLQRLMHIYTTLTGIQQRSRDSLVSNLRNSPLTCYHPQTFDVLRKLIGSQGLAKPGSHTLAPPVEPLHPGAPFLGLSPAPTPRIPAFMPRKLSEASSTSQDASGRSSEHPTPPTAAETAGRFGRAAHVGAAGVQQQQQQQSQPKKAAAANGGPPTSNVKPYSGIGAGEAASNGNSYSVEARPQAAAAMAAAMEASDGAKGMVMTFPEGGSAGPAVASPAAAATTASPATARSPYEGEGLVSTFVPLPSPFAPLSRVPPARPTVQLPPHPLHSLGEESPSSTGVGGFSARGLGLPLPSGTAFAAAIAAAAELAAAAATAAAAADSPTSSSSASVPHPHSGSHPSPAATDSGLSAVRSPDSIIVASAGSTSLLRSDSSLLRRGALGAVPVVAIIAPPPLHSSGDRGGHSGRSTPNPAALSTAPNGPPSLHAFLSRLPPGCSTGAALQLLDQVLVALGGQARNDWDVLLWVLHVTPLDLHKHLRGQWEARQAALLTPWLVSFWGRPVEHPILFIDATYAQAQPSPASPSSPRHVPNHKGELHAIVFVHGFQGACTDLRLVKAQLSTLFPQLVCFSSKANENRMQDSLQVMGQRLALELAEFLAPLSPPTSARAVTRLSFVGHSIGNLILRSALLHPGLAPHLPSLYLYISISGPHLGTLYTSNAVLDTGISLLKAVGRGRCLQQLSFSDVANHRDSHIYKLAHEVPLSAFRVVVLVSSAQDRYVPFHCARIATCVAAQRDARRGPIYHEMVAALLRGTEGAAGGTAAAAAPAEPTAVGDLVPLPPTQLFRVDVDFDLQSKGFSFSKLVGRTAHVEFVETQTWPRFLVWGVLIRHNLLLPARNAWL